MKLTNAVKLPLAVLVVTLAFGGLAKADSITDTNTTVDSASVSVDAGAGETFICLDQAFNDFVFNCTDTDEFTCYGWGNCSALGVTGGESSLAAFLEQYGSGPVQVIDAPLAVSAPEPGVLLLFCAGLWGLGLFKRRLRPALSTR